MLSKIKNVAMLHTDSLYILGYTIFLLNVSLEKFENLTCNFFIKLSCFSIKQKIVNIFLNVKKLKVNRLHFFCDIIIGQSKNNFA